jgi:hypothetical protein
MSVPPQNEQVQNQPSDKELNFRKQEEMFKRQLEQERQGRIQAEERASQLEKQRSAPDDDDDHSDEPYVDNKRLDKKLAKFGQKTMQQTQSEIKNAVNEALANERRQQWLDTNPDFYEVMQHADKFAEKAPSLAKTILNMPEGFDRQKLVYENIKAVGAHKKEEDKPKIQDTIDKRARSPYYQPSGVGASPYASNGDFSPQGQKQAYDKMKELKSRLRI